MSDLQRFPKADGSVLVVNPENGSSWTEAAPDDGPKDGPRATPFAKPVSQPAKAGDVVELKPSYSTNGDVAKAAPEQDQVEQLVHEADRKEDRFPFPSGAPELRNLLRLPFKKRAAAMELYQNALKSWNNMPANGTVLDSPEKVKRYYDALDAFNEFLLNVAVSEDAYEAWVASVDDGTFGKLFFAYISRFGLGEAASSSS